MSELWINFLVTISAGDWLRVRAAIEAKGQSSMQWTVEAIMAAVERQEAV